jgi:hypothetical protein
MISLNYCSLNLCSVFGRNMSRGARSWEWRGWRITTMFAVKITEQTNLYGLACYYQSWMCQLSGHFVLVSSVSYVAKYCAELWICCLALKNKLFMKNFLTVKTVNVSKIELTCPAPSVSVVEMGSSTGKTAALFPDHFHKFRFPLLLWSCKGSYCYFEADLASPCTQKDSFVCGRPSSEGAQSWHHLAICLNIHSKCIGSCCIIGQECYEHQRDRTVDNLYVHSSWPKCGHFWDMITIQRFVF